MKLQKIKKKTKLKLQSTFTFNRLQAIRLCKTAYYQAQAKNIAAYEFMEKEKLRLSTPKWDKVTDLLEFYKNLGLNDWTCRPAKILLGIYKKNKEAAMLSKQGKPVEVLNSNLITLVSEPQTLLLAYRAIKGNKGAMTRAAEVSLETLNNFNEKQKAAYYSSQTFPDKFSLRDVFITSELINKGLYPWGSSLRVYVPKPGSPDKQRPITIPPFLDRIVQKAISMVLEAIYEPHFEVQNRSFGFRPNKSTHDAITAVTSNYSSGKITAIEGDIEAAYDTVDKDKLIDILSKKIKDQKFLRLIKERLDYDFVETKEDGGELRIRPPLGIPQGGIDSPYLFNIYMKELDDFVHTDIQKFIDDLNGKLTVTRSLKKLYTHYASKRTKLRNARNKIKDKIKQLNDPDSIRSAKLELYNTIKITRLNRHIITSMKSEHPHKRILKILYVRYADDWILLTNSNRQIAEILKQKISLFLLNNLGLKLSEKKTSITDIRTTPAKFLGFELRHQKIGPLIRKPINIKDVTRFQTKKLQRKQGSTIIWASVDKQRLINRFHMKGFCDKDGFPRELPWLSALEPQVIVERYNSVIRGLCQFYFGFIRNSADLQRWIYILRFSCFKTLAQKYSTNIRGVFRKFGINQDCSSDRTIQIIMKLKVKKEIYTKDITLLTYKQIMTELKANFDRVRTVKGRFWQIEKETTIGENPLRKGSIPSITTKDYLDSISWVSLRTQASFAMPCANCGTTENVHQHHIRHIRKTAYELISKDLPYKQILALRNRKQIPLCSYCHTKVVHTGKYSGTALIKLAPTTLVDNRTIHVESFVKPGIEYHSKSLEERGWTKE